MRLKIFLICFILLLFTVTMFAREHRGNISFNKPSVLGQVTRMDTNNVSIPLRNDGAVFEADGKPGYYPNGQTILGFLFSGGFATSGYVDGALRCSWMTTASLLEEWSPGKWGMDPESPLAKFYEVSSSDDVGSKAYIDWADAVSLGADFQDVDPDGPGPLKPDGIYDPDLDHPDIIGDKIIWTVFNDNTVNTYPGGLGTQPLGLEIHQLVWAFGRQDDLGDVIFFRYRLINPTDHDVDDLIFTVWEDPDLGDYQDDLIGCDTTLSLGYIYNDGADNNYGDNPPAFGVDFFQGPIVESPGDTAFLYRGPVLGIDTVYDMRHLPMTSFMYYVQGGALLPDPRDKETARIYQEGGLDHDGNPLYPPDWGSGGTPETDPLYIFSGDPVAGTGWLDSSPADKRFMVNCGPFQLAVGDTQDIVVAYVVAQGTDALNSVAKLKSTDQKAQATYNANFNVAGPPPPPKVTARTFDQKIELIIDLYANGTYQYDNTASPFDRQVFEALTVYQFQSPNTTDMVRGVENAKVIKEYDIADQYNDLLISFPDGTVEKAWTAVSNINPADFQDPSSAVIKLTITGDAFNNNQPLINNKKYYFAVTAHSLNPVTAQEIGSSGNWILPGTASFLGSSRAAAFVTVLPGESEFAPFKGDGADYAGPQFREPLHEGSVFVNAVEPNKLTGHEYEVSFFNDGNFWVLKDMTADSIPSTTIRGDVQYIDSMTVQAIVGEGEEAWNFPIVDGFSVQVHNVPDGLDTAVVDSLNVNNVAWLEGAHAYNNVIINGRSPAVLDSSIIFVKQSNRANLATGIAKEDYFPVKFVFDTTESALGYHYLSGWSNQPPPVFGDEKKPILMKAFDMSDSDNPRQLNVAFTSPAPIGKLDFASNQEIIIFDSDYSGDVNSIRYTGAAAADSLFKKEAYLICQLRLVADSLMQANRMEINITPYYPNSDVDSYQFDTQTLLPNLDLSKRKSLLDNVKVVPNPYFAYSTYETSYDLPQIKFIHLDKKATIRIFNLAGQLVKTLRKNDDSNELTWDLRNESRLKIASGMYIAHIEVPGVGEKILKFGIVQREERIDRY